LNIFIYYHIFLCIKSRGVLIKRFLTHVGIFTLAVLLTTCDLFTGIPKADLLDQIDEAIAWAKAERVSVSIAFPQEWGQVPPGLDLSDLRKGHAFNVNFTPNPEFGLIEWRAYATDELGDEWIDNPIRYFDPNQNPPDQITDVVLPARVNDGGGLSSVIVNTTRPVTLIPFSRSQPRIIRSQPARGNVHGRNFHSRIMPITITFASPLDKESIGSLGENIRIWMHEIDASGKAKEESLI